MYSEVGWSTKCHATELGTALAGWQPARIARSVLKGGRSEFGEQPQVCTARYNKQQRVVETHFLHTSRNWNLEQGRLRFKHKKQGNSLFQGSSWGIISIFSSLQESLLPNNSEASDSRPSMHLGNIFSVGILDRGTDNLRYTSAVGSWRVICVYL